MTSVISRHATNRAASCLRKSDARSGCRLSAKCCRIGPKDSRNFCVRFGSRKPRMRRSRSRVGWWLFSARLFSRAAALTNTCTSNCKLRKLRDLGFCRRIAAQLISDYLARHGVRAQHPLEETFGRGLVAPLLHQDVEFGAMLVDRTPQQIRFAAQRDEHLVKLPRAARIASRRLYAVSKALAKFVAPASDRLVCHGHTALEEQFLDVAQAQLKAEGSMTLREARAGPPWGN